MLQAPSHRLNARSIATLPLASSGRILLPPGCSLYKNIEVQPHIAVTSDLRRDALLSRAVSYGLRCYAVLCPSLLAEANTLTLACRGPSRPPHLDVLDSSDLLLFCPIRKLPAASAWDPCGGSYRYGALS
eukprot:scaffold10_cov257-Pinguiococcus_pyrenoidosus.AAC.26